MYDYSLSLPLSLPLSFHRGACQVLSLWHRSISLTEQESPKAVTLLPETRGIASSDGKTSVGRRSLRVLYIDIYARRYFRARDMSLSFSLAFSGKYAGGGVVALSETICLSSVTPYTVNTSVREKVGWRKTFCVYVCGRERRLANENTLVKY